MRQLSRKLPLRLPPLPIGICAPVNLNQRRTPLNEFNACLQREAGVWEYIRSCGGLEKHCCPQKYLVPPWLRMPPEGRRFQKISSIPTPAMDGLDHQVLQFSIPVGWDGTIQALVHFYTGLGFLEGSGQLTWRYLINRRYIRDYGAVPTTLGSLTTPYPVFQGPIRLISRQVVTVMVNNAVASGIAGGRIVAAAFGWTYPR